MRMRLYQLLYMRFPA